MDKKRVLKSMVASVIVALSFVFCLYDRTYAVAPTPPSRQGYSSSVYFEAVTYDFDESGGTGTGIGRYSKVQRVSVRFTDLASGLVLLTPTWDSSVSSSIKQLITSNIRCFDCTVTYSNDKFYIRPAGTMQCTFEILYPNYATSALSFNTTPYFTFTASSFDDSGLLGYEVPVYDQVVHSDLSAIASDTSSIKSVVQGLGTSLSNIEVNTNTLRTDVQNISQAVNSISGNTNQTNSFLAGILSSLGSSGGSAADVTQQNQNLNNQVSDIQTQGTNMHNAEDGVMNAMDAALTSNELQQDITTTIRGNDNLVSSLNWVSSQVTHMITGFNSITPMWEFMFILPLLLGIALAIVGKLK